MAKKAKKVYVNSHHFLDKDSKEYWFCGYRVGKKYKEQTEYYATEQEAKDALNG